MPGVSRITLPPSWIPHSQSTSDAMVRTSQSVNLNSCTTMRNMILFGGQSPATKTAYLHGRMRTLNRVHDLPEDHHPGTLRPVSGCAGLAGIPILGPHHDPSSAGTRLLQGASLVLSERSSRRFIFTNRQPSGMSPTFLPEASPCLPTPLPKTRHRPQFHSISQCERGCIRYPLRSMGQWKQLWPGPCTSHPRLLHA